MRIDHRKDTPSGSDPGTVLPRFGSRSACNCRFLFSSCSRLECLCFRKPCIGFPRRRASAFPFRLAAWPRSSQALAHAATGLPCLSIACAQCQALAVKRQGKNEGPPNRSAMQSS